MQNGITEGSLWYRCRKIVEMPNVRRLRLSASASGQPQFADGYPSYLMLYTAEIPWNAAYSSQDRGYGNVYFYTTNA